MYIIECRCGNSFSLLYSIPLCEYNTVYLSILHLKDIWVASKFLTTTNGCTINILVHVFW